MVPNGSVNVEKSIVSSDEVAEVAKKFVDIKLKRLDLSLPITVIDQ